MNACRLAFAACKEAICESRLLAFTGAGAGSVVRPLKKFTTRLPGPIDAAETAFASTADLASALRRVEAAHGEHEKRTGQRDANWPGWYAAYMVAEQAGTELPA